MAIELVGVSLRNTLPNAIATTKQVSGWELGIGDVSVRFISWAVFIWLSIFRERDESGHSETGETIVRIWTRFLAALKKNSFKDHDYIDIVGKASGFLAGIVGIIVGYFRRQHRALASPACVVPFAPVDAKEDGPARRLQDDQGSGARKSKNEVSLSWRCRFESMYAEFITFSGVWTTTLRLISLGFCWFSTTCFDISTNRRQRWCIM